VTTLTRGDLMLLIESLSGTGALNEEQWRWIARLRRESNQVDPTWGPLKKLADTSVATRTSLRELLESQNER
jgi:hypothetical protein